MGYVGNVVSDGDNNLVGSTLYGTCNTAASTAAKVVTLTDYDALLEGTTIHVKFQYTNTAAEPTLNVNGTGPYPLYADGVNYPGNTPLTSWKANSMLSLTFDGSAWRLNDTFNYGDLRADLLNLVYPVGAIYLSTQSTSPASLFGGTWTQIKDTFLLTAGTTYAAGATGGAAEVTLETANLPSHSHTVAAHKHTLGDHVHTMAHTHGLNNHTHNMEHTHGLNSHVHSLNSHVHSLNGHTHSISASGSTNTTGSHSHDIFYKGGSGETWGFTWEYATSGASSDGMYGAGNHSHTVSVSGTSGGPSTGNTGASSGNTGAASGNTSGASASNTGGASGNTTGASTDNTGAASGYTGELAGFNTGNTGSGTAHNNMPPYLVVYCWRRTA